MIVSAFSNCIAWIYWDPPREVFVIPFLERPIFWYGILFVTGFILGYFLLIAIFTRFIDRCTHISSLDVPNWPALMCTLKVKIETDIFKKNMPLHTSKQILQSNQGTGEQPSEQLCNDIIDGLNSILKKKIVSRSQLLELLDNKIMSIKNSAYALNDRLCWFLVIGTLLGARLGELFFYDWHYFIKHPAEIFKTWHGGLASHGGVLGVIVAVRLFQWHAQRYYPSLSFLHLLDFVAIPGALVACFIRIGNFMNQEIIGLPSEQPWAVVFGHPMDGSVPFPSHPVQLYEALAYLSTFIVLWILWKKEIMINRPGGIIGLLFILIFSSRFILEYWKAPIPSIFSNSFLQTGQLLSIPFIVLGILFVTGCYKRISSKHSHHFS